MKLLRPKQMQPSWLVKLITCVFMGLVVCGGLLGLDWLYPLNHPQQGGQQFAQVVVDAQGRPLRVFADKNGIWRYPVTPDQVSPIYLNVLIAYEDQWFYNHPGVNPLALLRALGQWIYHGEVVSGGSTLTMQVARLLHPHPRTVTGKLQQVLRALQLEWHYSKSEILTLYLNYAPFGGTLEGVQAASFTYLGKPASQLTHAEAALLVVLPQRPSAWRPDRYPARAETARNKVIQRMAQFQHWSSLIATEAKQEPVIARTNSNPMLAPLLARRLRQLQPQRALIKSTIDGQLQLAVQQLLLDHSQTLPAKTSTALLLVNNQTVAVEAYVGTAEFANQQRAGHIDMIQALRSPGSTLKPFIYGMAFDQGLVHSASLLSDVPTDFDGYRPVNFDHGFSGPISLAEALRRSLNVPAVQVLSELGPERFYARLAHAGIKPQLPYAGKPNLALALGGTSLSLELLTQAYTALGRQGNSGQLRLRPEQPLRQRRLMSEGAAWMVQNLLRTSLNANSSLYRYTRSQLPQIAFKTGTSYGFRDAWALASTQRYTVGVWVGRPDGSALLHNTGRMSAVPILEKVVNLLQPQDLQPSAKPATVNRASICWPLGTLQHLQSEQLCHRPMTAWVLQGTAPPTLRDRLQGYSEANTIMVATDQAGQYQIPPSCAQPPAQHRSIALWPLMLDAWLPSRWQRKSLLPQVHPNCTATQEQVLGQLVIGGVTDGATLVPLPGDSSLPDVMLQVEGAQGIVHWFLNGEWQGTAEATEPWPVKQLNNGWHELTVIDQVGKWARIGFRVRGQSDVLTSQLIN